MAPKRTTFREARFPSPPTHLPSPTPVEERKARALAPRTTENPPTMEFVTLRLDGYGDATGGHVRGVGIPNVCIQGLDIKNIQSAEAR